jgi:hypothetical protein
VTVGQAELRGSAAARVALPPRHSCGGGGGASPLQRGARGGRGRWKEREGGSGKVDGASDRLDITSLALPFIQRDIRIGVELQSVDREFQIVPPHLAVQ